MTKDDTITLYNNKGEPVIGLHELIYEIVKSIIKEFKYEGTSLDRDKTQS